MANISVDTILKLPRAQKVIILVVIIGAIFGSYFYFIYNSSKAELEAKHQELSKLQAKHTEQQNIIANLDKYKKELKDSEVKFQESLKLLPDTREIPSLLTNISNLAQESGLKIMLFQPKSELPKDFYADIPVDMQVSGNYHDFGYFCDRISKMDRIVNITDITLKSNTGKKSDQRSTIEAKFKAVTFKFLKKDKASGKKKKRRRRR